MMSVEEAARRVLERAGEPLHYREITRRALRLGWLDRSLRVPATTMHVRLAVDILAYGHVSRFQRQGSGAFALRTWGLPEAPWPRRPVARRRRPQAPTGPKLLPLLEALERTLRETASGGPLTADEMIRRAQSEGWLPAGQHVPLATVAAAISTDNRRRIERNEAPRFVVHGLGSYSLPEAESDVEAVAAANGLTRQALLAQVQSMPPSELAPLIEHTLRTVGFSSVESIQVGPEGIIQLQGEFLIADALRSHILIHVYPGGRRQSAAAVKALRQALPPFAQGLVIAGGDFSLVACAEATRPDAAPIGVISGYDLITLMINHKIGVRRNEDGHLMMN